jgi:hypothetical protein
MSFQAMTWAIGQKLPAKEKLVLLMLANYCNSHTRQCNPSHSRLSEECGMSKNTLLSAIKSLESKAHLQVIRKRIGDVNLPNQYELNFSGGSAEIEPLSSLNALGSATDALRGSAVFAPEPVIIKPVIEPKRTTTTQTENFENLGTKLNALHREVFEWACTDSYWVKCTNSEEDFLSAYCSPKGGMRKQFETYKNTPNTGGNNGTHRQPPKKLSPAERVRKAAGIGEFAVGAGGSESDYLEHNRD